VNYLTLLITLPLTIFSVLFVVSNTGSISLYLYPGAPEQQVPIYLLGMVLLGGGFFLGALFVGLHAQKTTILYWREQQRAARLEKELDELQVKKDAAEDIIAPPAGQKFLS
jgi:uncharacterized integral membrane protein